MKIGIESMQRVVNYGSFLQAYGLKKTIEALGHEAVFFDYTSRLPVTGFTAKGLLADKIRRNVFFSWFEDELRSHERLQYRWHREFLPMLGIGYKRNPTEKVDIAVIGSDEVFNCLQPFPNVGFSPMLFGQGIRAQKVISYAASFGYTTLEGLEKYDLVEKLTKYLSSFSALSVRDENSRRIVTSLTGREPYIHLDPVLIYDFELPKVELPAHYVLLYTYLSRPYSAEERQQIKNFCKQNGKQLVSLGWAQDWVERKISADPFQVLAFFNNADYVITDTFHGAVMSIKYNRNFACMVRPDNRQKLKDLLQRLEQQSREITDFSSAGLFKDKSDHCGRKRKCMQLSHEAVEQL